MDVRGECAINRNDKQTQISQNKSIISFQKTPQWSDIALTAQEAPGVFDTGIILLFASTKRQKQSGCCCSRRGSALRLCSPLSVCVCVDLNAGCCHV